jgi:hypothetical protein
MAGSKRWVYVMPWDFFVFAHEATRHPARKIQASLSPATIDLITEALLVPAATYGEISDPNLMGQILELFKDRESGQRFLERINRRRKISPTRIPDAHDIHLDMLRKKAFLMTRELLAHHPLKPLDGRDAGNVKTTYLALVWFVEKNGGSWTLDDETTNELLEGFMDQQFSDDELEKWIDEHIELEHDDHD